jgi:hypothetical protein
MKKFVYVSLMALAVLMPVLVLAQLTDPIIPSSGPIPTLDRVEVLLRRIGTFLIMIAIVIAVIVLVWGGITYMTAGGDEAKATAAKTRIWNGIIGAAVVLAVGLILQTLASILTQTFFGV